MRIPIYQIDAFTNEQFKGNPAAVCPLEALEPRSFLRTSLHPRKSQMRWRGKESFLININHKSKKFDIDIKNI